MISKTKGQQAISPQKKESKIDHKTPVSSIGQSPYENPYRAALYIRTSTSGQDTDNQRPVLQDFCSNNGWPIVAEYIDQAKGWREGRPQDRPQFRQLFEDASRRKFDVVVFWSVDRFTREGARKTLDYLTQLAGYGVKFRSYTQQFFDTCGPFSDAVVAIMATLAELERKQICDRVIAGMERARRNGILLGRPRITVNMERLTEMSRHQSYQEISAATGLSRATISRRIQQFKSG